MLVKLRTQFSPKDTLMGLDVLHIVDRVNGTHLGTMSLVGFSKCVYLMIVRLTLYPVVHHLGLIVHPAGVTILVVRMLSTDALV
jgi:hypothetical protein